MPTLYLVGTPIGNLEDITLRALRILREVKVIAAEDTRVTRKLLARYEIESQLVSFHDFSGQSSIDFLLETLAGGDIALVSDAGMPGLSDPGYRLVQAAIKAGVEVTPIPGPSAAIAALVSSGLPTNKFLYLGFLPRRQENRRQELAALAHLPFTLVVYEAPHRLISLLRDMEKIMGNRQICVGRELTKMYEEIWRGNLHDAILHFEQGEMRGEFTIVLAGEEQREWELTSVRRALQAEIDSGLSRKDAVEVVASLSGWRKRDVYRLSLEIMD